MTKRIEEEIRQRIEMNGSAHHLEQLNLDGLQIRYFTPTIKRLLQSCRGLEYLTLNDCKLSSLENFPALRNLIGLEMSDNRLRGEDLHLLKLCPGINFLSLDCNEIADISAALKLQCLPQLDLLEIHDNPFCDEPDYIRRLFSSFRSVTKIDCTDRLGNKVLDDDVSEYITNRERSRNDLADLLPDEDEDDDLGQKEIDKTSDAYIEPAIEEAAEKKASPFNLVVSPPAPARQNFQHRLWFMRTGLAEDSDSDQDQDLMTHFRKKMHKQE